MESARPTQTSVELGIYVPLSGPKVPAGESGAVKNETVLLGNSDFRRGSGPVLSHFMDSPRSPIDTPTNPARVRHNRQTSIFYDLTVRRLAQ